MANIMSLGVITDKYRVTMDSAIDNAFIVHVSKDKKVRFGRDDAYVYTHVPTKLGKKKHEATKTPPESGCFVQSVEENKLFYTPREVNRAKRARELLIASGSPSTADLKVAIATNAIANNPMVTEAREQRQESQIRT